MSEFTAKQVIEHMNQRVPRLTAVLDEVLAILHDNLPAVLEELGLPAIRAWDYAGGELDPARSPAILVGASARAVEQGIYYADDIHLLVTICYPPRVTRRQLQDAVDIAQAVRGVLQMPQVVGPRRKDGTVLWNWLLPAGYNVVPPSFPYYSGYIAEFVLRQAPPTNLWGATED